MIASYKNILTNMHEMSQLDASNALDGLALYYLTLSAWYDNNGDPIAAAYFESKSAAYRQQAAVIMLCTSDDWEHTQEISRQFAEAQSSARGARKYRIAATKQARYAAMA